jgi:Predicted membrane protein (DUF2207) C-terminal domain
VGRDPKKGEIMPRPEPPAGFSLAGVRFLARMAFDNKVFSAAVVEMTVKKYVPIGHQDGVFTLQKNSQAHETGLAPEERVVASRLFQGASYIALMAPHRTRVQGAMQDLKKSLSTRTEKVYFHKNSRYLVPCVVLSIITVRFPSITPAEPSVARSPFS